MRLTMIRNRDNVQVPQSYCDFTAPGGTIGRGTDNTLVLPDQTRAISRLQAVVHISPGGETYITQRGSTTPLLLNGEALAHDVQQPLADGDTLDIDGYRFSVSLGEAPPLIPRAPLIETEEAHAALIDDEVWANLEAEFPLRGASRAQPVQHDPNHPLFIVPAENRRNADPLAMAQETDLAALQEVITDPGRLFTQEEPFAQPTIMKNTTPTVLFAHAPSTPQELAEESAVDDSRPETESYFSLFNSEPELSTPPVMTLGTDGDDEDDPLNLFMDSAVPLTSTTDNFSFDAIAHKALLPAAEQPAFPDEERPFPPPPREESPVPTEITWTESARPEPACVEPLAPFNELQPPNALPTEIAWTEPVRAEPPAPFNDSPPSGESTTEIAWTEPAHAEPLAPFSDAPYPPPAAQSEEAPAAGRLGIDPVRHPSFSAEKSPAGKALDGELFDAFVAGLGLDDVPVQPAFTPEQMFLAGKLLSLFSQGTVALLSSRSILKRGLKAEMTVILEEENNPFKMLPSGKTVLMQMFSTPMPGFIPPESAVRNALIDLQAHQLGMIAGVRAIIAAMLQTFHPDALEKMAAERGDLAPRGLFSGNRKAMLWDMLKTHYQQVANEVEDDFHTLFGEAFLHAYDLEIRQYKALQNQKRTS